MATKNKRLEDIEGALEPDEVPKIVVIWSDNDERLAEARARGDTILKVEWCDDYDEPEQTT